MVPFQIIYTRKAERCLPKNATGKKIFYFLLNDKHWSNEVETLSLIDKITASYIENVKQELHVLNNQKSLLIWDAFKGQGTPRAQERLSVLGVVFAMVPKNMTHLLQLLDVTIPTVL